IEKLIANYQKTSTENEQIEELEGNYQELVKVNADNIEVIKNQELEIQKLKDRIEELMDTHNATPQTSTDIETRFQKLEELIMNQINPQSPVTNNQSPVTNNQSPVPSHQSAACERNQQELELMGNADLWQSKKSGVVAEKIRRCFMALCVYNNEVATGDNDRVAITNIVLRNLSGANGQVVSSWMKHHKDEILEHNNKFAMGSKDHNKLYTVFNRGKNTDQ
ncbi:MAG: hypothetical protein ACKPE3_32620, partial [Sphaerospermopsis kisseleviana]